MERQFLVQRILLWAENERENTLMSAGELIHYIDMQDYCEEDYHIYEITEFGTIIPIYYFGWQPDCLIEFVDDNGTVVLSGYGVDH